VKEIKANPLVRLKTLLNPVAFSLTHSLSRRQIGRDMKIAKHPEQRFTTAVLTNGATVFTRLPYYTSKYLRLEEDYISIAANQKIRPLPLKEKRVQPPKYAKGRRRPKRVE
jgi:hypothetical protein